MGNWNGEGKVHTKSKSHGNIDFGTITMFQWKPRDYKVLVARFERICGSGNRTAIREAINRAAYNAAQLGKAETKRLLAEVTTLKVTDIAKHIKVYKYGSPLSMDIGMKISDTVRPLSNFSFTPAGPKYRTAPIVEIYRGKKNELVKGAFVARMPKTGHIEILEREKDKNGEYVTRKSYTSGGGFNMKSKEHVHLVNPFLAPAITGIFKENEKVHNEVWEKIFSTFEKNVEDELANILGGKK